MALRSGNAQAKRAGAMRVACADVLEKQSGPKTLIDTPPGVGKKHRTPRCGIRVDIDVVSEKSEISLLIDTVVQASVTTVLIAVAVLVFMFVTAGTMTLAPGLEDAATQAGEGCEGCGKVKNAPAFVRHDGSFLGDQNITRGSSRCGSIRRHLPGRSG